MASVQDSSGAIRSVTNTRQDHAGDRARRRPRLRRAQTRIEAMRPYADTMRELIAGVGRAAPSVRGLLPLLQQRETIETVADRRRSRATAASPARSTPRSSAGRSRSSGSCAAEARKVALASPSARRAARRSRSAAARRRRRYVGFIGSARRTADAQAIAHRVAELYIERRGRPRRPRPQRVRLGARRRA